MLLIAEIFPNPVGSSTGEKRLLIAREVHHLPREDFGNIFRLEAYLRVTGLVS